MTTTRGFFATIVSLLATGGVAMAQSEGAAPTNMQLFLLIGQSNMAGRGVIEEQDKTPHPRVFALNKEGKWGPAVDPLHWDKPDIAGVGLGTTFGVVVAEARPTAKIGLIPAAFGGSSLDEWKPGSRHYTNAVERARHAMKSGKLVGILWHQGESDSAPEKAATYPERFAAMIKQLRADLGVGNIPVIVGETGRFRPDGAAINAAIAKVPHEVIVCAFVSADGLKDKGDKLHFDSASLRELGHRYAEKWMELAQP